MCLDFLWWWRSGRSARRSSGARGGSVRLPARAGCTGHRPNSFQAEVATSRPKKIQKKARILVDLLNHSDTVSRGYVPGSTQTGYSPGFHQDSNLRSWCARFSSGDANSDGNVTMPRSLGLTSMETSVNLAYLYCSTKKPFLEFFWVDTRAKPANRPQRGNQRLPG